MHRPENHVAEEWVAGPDIEVAVLDADGVIVAVNGPWADFCEANEGNPLTTGVGVDYLEVCRKAEPDPEATKVAAAIKAALVGSAPVAERIRISCHSPSQRRWFDVFVTSRTGGGGQTIGATVMLTQVSEPRADVVDADHSLAWEILEAIPDAVVMADDDGIVESMNDPAERLFGCGRRELIGRPIESLLPGCCGDDKPLRMQLGAVRPDGYEIPVEVTFNRRDVRGQPRLIASIRDITERLRSEGRVHLIDRCIDCASDAILVLDEDNLKFTHVNRGAVEMFGYDRNELIGQMSPSDLAPDLSLAELANALAALRRSTDGHVRLTTTGHTKRGQQLPIEIQIDWPSPASPNGPRPVVAVARQIMPRPIMH